MVALTKPWTPTPRGHISASMSQKAIVLSRSGVIGRVAGGVLVAVLAFSFCCVFDSLGCLSFLFGLFCFLFCLFVLV